MGQSREAVALEKVIDLSDIITKQASDARISQQASVNRHWQREFFSLKIYANEGDKLPHAYIQLSGNTG